MPEMARLAGIGNGWLQGLTGVIIGECDQKTVPGRRRNEGHRVSMFEVQWSTDRFQCLVSLMDHLLYSDFSKH